MKLKTVKDRDKYGTIAQQFQQDLPKECKNHRK